MIPFTMQKKTDETVLLSGNVESEVGGEWVTPYLLICSACLGSMVISTFFEKI